MESAQIFDRDGALKRLDGDESLLAELVSLFLNSIPGRVVPLAQSCGKEPDFVTLARLAHSFVGASRTVGANQIATIARELDDAARLEDERAVRTLLKKLEETIAAFKYKIGSLS